MDVAPRLHLESIDFIEFLYKKCNLLHELMISKIFFLFFFIFMGAT
jgi:hypothetical protein